MSVSLYELSVPTFLQTMRALAGCLDRAAKHCVGTGGDPDEFVDARLCSDMAPFYFQIEALVHHSVWGIEAAMTGVFDPPPLVGSVPFAELQAFLDRGVASLEAFTPEQVNACAGQQLEMEIYQPVDEANATTSRWGPRMLPFKPETYLLSYAMPNFYFHVVTAYDILRMRGVPIGKFHYEGRLRTGVN